MVKQLLLLLLTVPILMAGGGPDPYQQQTAHVSLEPSTNWTLIIVAVITALGSIVPAYLGFKQVQKRRQRKQEEN